MSYRDKRSVRTEHGFTLVELLIVMVMVLVVSATFYTFFKSSFFTYLDLQKDASNLTELTAKSHRMGNVVRGLTDIESAAAEEIVIYGYFYPTDTYVSLIRYYKNAGATALLADVTPMTSNPPIGTPITSDKKTYTIMNNFQQTPSTSLFQYLDSTGTVLGLPIADLNIVKGVRINLGVGTSTASINQAMVLEVSLRNRKTNL